MPGADEEDQSGSHAPLLASSRPSSDHDDNEHDESLASELEYSGGWFIWALTFSAGISGLLFGYDTGVISSTLVTIGSDLSSRPLTTLDKSLITSCTSLFALIASPFTGVLADKFGRRKVILGADLLFALGALVQAFTSQVWGMVLGRSIVGLAVGSASAVTPLYISELAPSHARGRLVTILSLFITGGQVVAYIVGWLFSSTAGGWRWIVGIGALPAFFQLAILALLPETPRWLVQAGFDARAKTVLIKIYQDCPGHDQVVDRVLRNISGEIAREASEMGLQEDSEIGPTKSRGTKPQWLHDTIQRGQQLLHGGNRRALIIAMMLQAVQQLCGFNSLMYFSATIFSSLSFSSPTLTSLSVAMTNFVSTLLAFVLIDKMGRRRILLYSIPVMAIALVLCAFSFSSVDDKWNSQPPTGRQDSHDSVSSLVPIAILFCLTVYTAAYALGLGNVPWQQSELFPLNVRSLGSGLATATNWGSNFIIGLTFLPMMEWISPSWTFALYALVCVVGWIAVWAIYPEMSGLSLEEVKGLLADGWGVTESLQRRHLLRHI
ncbi:unnamed protein product [Penicillium nalgiovense]|nr:unnamed protein product [Penicillium nalgiovense]